MPAYIIHRDGAFNVFSTVVDNCYFEPACTRAELEEWYRNEHGASGMRELPARLERAIATGTSAFNDTLEHHSRSCLAGPKGGRISPEEFVMRFLTLQDQPQEVR